MSIQIEERRSYSLKPSIQGVQAIFGRRAFSWSGVWAGALTGVALQLLCSLAIDARFYLLGGQTPLAGIPILAAVWYLVYMTASFWVAGAIAGQTGGDAGNRFLHGLVAWALCSLIGFNTLIVWEAWQTQGIISQGWMLAGTILGMIAALYGAIQADRIDF